MPSRIRLVVMCWLCAVLLSGGCGPARSAKKYRIVVIPKGTTHLFWQAIHAGALKAAREHGDVEIVWQGPSQEDSHDEQRKIVERFVSENVSAVVLAPSDREMLVAPVEAALGKGIPVVIIDSGLAKSPGIEGNAKYLGYVATNNEEGGRRAARRLHELLKDTKNPKVLMMPYQAGSQSTELREKGFREEFKKLFPGIKLIVSTKESGATVNSAHQAAEQELSLYKNLDGIFTPNESSTVGMLQALRSLGRAGKVKVVGFDSSEILIGALKSGEIHGLVLQDPLDMGYQSVKRAIDFLEKGTRPQNLTLNTNLRIATAENLDDATIKKMYSPDLSIRRE